ncbi:MAG: hypothetical protein H7281_09405 [Bacteriovorax sp.]|nr:hypothetical protein [Bacteriovorax sp.]
MKHILLLLFLLILSSCSTTDSGVYKKSISVENKLTEENLYPWSTMSSEGSDFALQNKNTKSLFLFNSACRKYEASTLNSLTSSMLAGIEDVKITENKNVFYQNREAVEVAANGKLDGVIRFFRIVTIQKNNCIYDYILISTNQKNLDADSPSLKLFLQRIILN